MALIESLPNELLVAILRQLPQDSLVAVMKASRKLGGPAATVLYCAVYLWEKGLNEQYHLMYKEQGNPVPHVPDWQTEHHQCCVPFGSDFRQETRIFGLDCFLRTLSASTSLCSLVKGASFECQLIGQEVVATKVMKLLASSSVSHIHLTPEKYNPDLYKSQLTSHPSTTHFTALTSLQVNWLDIRVGEAVYDSSVVLDQDKLYFLFCIESLKSLSIVGVRCWNSFNEVATPGRSKTSNITCLSLPQSVSAGRDLVELLKWPKTLKSLWYEIWHDEFPIFDPRNKYLSGADLVAALDRQKSTLEELYIHGDHYDSHRRGIFQIANLNHFTKLRRIGIPFTFLAITEWNKQLREIYPGLWEEKYEEDYYRRVDTKLPPSVEELQLGLDDQQSEDEDEFAEGELCKYLNQIATSKMLYYKGLRKLVLWQESKRYHCVAIRHSDLEDIPGKHKLPETFEEAAIQFSHTRSFFPPLFSATRRLDDPTTLGGVGGSSR